MSQITIQFKTKKEKFDPDFFVNLNTLAQEYDIHMEKKNSEMNKEEYYEARKRQLDEFIRKADALAEGMAPQTIDSTDIIREDRERL